MRRLPPAFLMLLAPLPMVAGCAAKGPFPSLAPRAVERELAEADAVQPVAVVIADDPALASRVAALLADAKAGDAEFEGAIASLPEAVRAPGPAGSETWVEAQQAISRIDAARARTARAVADLDALGLARAEGQPTSAADFARIEAAIAEAQTMADRQQERSAQLRAALSPPP